MPASKAAARAHADDLDDEEEIDEEEEDDEEDGDEEDDGDADEGAEEAADSDDPDEDDEDEDEDELDDEWTPPDDVSHWMVRRVVVRPDGRPWVNDAAPMLTFGQDAHGVPTKRWTVDEWNAGTLQARFGAGTYQPFWMEVKPNGKFKPRGFGPALTLNDASAPAPAPAPLPPPAPPPPPATMAPPSFVAAAVPPPPSDLQGWDPVMARAFEQIPEASRATLAHVRLLDDMLERRMRSAIEGERVRGQQFLQAMAAQSDATLRAILTIVAPPPPPPAAALSATSSPAGLPDLQGLVKFIADVKALALEGGPSVHAAQPIAEEANPDPTVARAQTVMAVATIAQQVAEVIGKLAPLFIKPTATPTAEAAAAAAGASTP